MNTPNNPSYTNLIALDTLEERYNYLKIGGIIGIETFGSNRYLNQMFYKTPEWRSIRNQAIIRDEGCELGHRDYPIHGRIYIHHIVPITELDIANRSSILLDLDNVICCSQRMHEAIHYGDDSIINIYHYTERKPNDTCPWKA